MSNPRTQPSLDSSPKTSRGKRFCLSVDLDPLSAYCQIHSLSPPDPGLESQTLASSIERFVELGERTGCPITFFAVASSLRGPARDALREAARRGHEIANHTQSHPYGFLQLSPDEMAREIEEAQETLSALSPEPISGFRAPGYGATPEMLRTLVRLGYRYDSSLLPSPPYYLAKATVMGAMRLTGRPSGAAIHDPRSVLGPQTPYVPDPKVPHRRDATNHPSNRPEHHLRLLELPISVVPWLRVPIIGTTLALAPPWLTKVIQLTARNMKLVNFECHAIDLADRELDRIPDAIVAHQPDLRVSLAKKRERLERFVSHLVSTTHSPSTLKQASDHLLSEIKAPR